MWGSGGEGAETVDSKESDGGRESRVSEFGLTYTVEIRDDYEFGIVPGARSAP